MEKREMPKNHLHARARTAAAIATLFVPLVLGTAAPNIAAAAQTAQAVKPDAAFDTWSDRFAADWVRACVLFRAWTAMAERSCRCRTLSAMAQRSSHFDHNGATFITL